MVDTVCNKATEKIAISFILFCVYIDDLLQMLAQSNLGCYIDHMFIRALGYTDDVVLLAPCNA